MTALLSVSSLATVMPENAVVEKLLPIAKSLATDSVVNVRLNVARSLQALHNRVLKRVASDDIIPLLRTLTRDSDGDVQFYAKTGIESISNYRISL